MRKRLTGSLAAGLIVLAIPTHADTSDTIEIVETRSQFEIVLIDADFVSPQDPSDSVIGGTNQFVDAETIIAELTLTEPISRTQLDNLKDADASGGARFQCESATLYRVEGWLAVAGTQCIAVDNQTGSGG